MPGEPAFTCREVRGAAIEPWLEELGRLRIEVFQEFPYLYEGDLDYERNYLRVYLGSPRSLVVLLEHEGRLVGASTCLPLEDEGPAFQAPFLRAGMDVATVFYLGESVILPAYRGHGAGHEFFQRRERQAQVLESLRFTAFCAVDRPDDHPARPEGYRPLDAFWTRMGYAARPDLRCEFPWKEVGDTRETTHTLTYWLKAWA